MHQLSKILACEHPTMRKWKAFWNLSGSDSPFSRSAAGLVGGSGVCDIPAGSHPRGPGSLRTLLLAALSLLSTKSSSPVGGRAKPAVCFKNAELMNWFSSAKAGVVMGYNRASRAAAYSHEVQHPCPWGGSWVWKSSCWAFVLPSLRFHGVRWVGFGQQWRGSLTLLCANSCTFETQTSLRSSEGILEKGGNH